MACKIIAIAGGTGSGKSTLADRLAQQLDANVLRIDDYYRPLNHLTFEEREQVNFDSPDAIDHVLLEEHLSELQRGRSVEKPIYDFSKHTRAVFGEVVEPKSTIIVEGLFALYWKGLNELCDTKIFVETPRDIRFERRLKRDIEERGRDEAEVTLRFNSHVNPMHDFYVQPTAAQADLVVYGNDDLEVEVSRALGTLVESKPVLL